MTAVHGPVALDVAWTGVGPGHDKRVAQKTPDAASFRINLSSVRPEPKNR